jgi:hypothetical protein
MRADADLKKFGVGETSVKGGESGVFAKRRSSATCSDGIKTTKPSPRVTHPFRGSLLQSKKGIRVAAQNAHHF